MRILFLPFLFLFAFLVSCKQDNDETLEKTVNAVDVYVAGRENNQACYWKNTIKTVLSSSNGFDAGQIIFDNSDLYITGSKHDGLTGITDYCYWKNNVKYDIQQVLNLQATDDFHFNDIIFKNGNIHILGSIKNPVSTSVNDAYQLCYWKNGTKTVVENQHSSFPNNFGQKMYFFNNDLYITSSKNYDPLNYTSDLGYYKNGTYNFISNTNYRKFMQFFNDGSNLHMITLGFNGILENYNISTNVFSPLPSFINYSNFHTLIKDGADTYYTGSNTYYKNNNLITLPNNGGYVIYRDFKVLDGNIYSLKQKDSDGIVGQKVFINNVETQSIISNNTNNRFNSLTIVPQ
jgi:hypothetical protein